MNYEELSFWDTVAKSAGDPQFAANRSKDRREREVAKERMNWLNRVLPQPGHDLRPGQAGPPAPGSTLGEELNPEYERERIMKELFASRFPEDRNIGRNLLQNLLTPKTSQAQRDKWEIKEDNSGRLWHVNPYTLERRPFDLTAEVDPSGYSEHSVKDVQAIYNQNPVTKQFINTQSAVTNVNGLLNQRTPASDQAAVMAYAKAISGGDVTTDADLRAIAQSNGGVFAMLYGMLEKAASGQLREGDRAALKSAAGELLANSQQSLADYQSRFEPQLGKHNPADVFVSTGRVTTPQRAALAPQEEQISTKVQRSIGGRNKTRPKTPEDVLAEKLKQLGVQ